MTDEPFTDKSEEISATVTGTLDLTGNILESPHVFIAVASLDSVGAVITPTAGTYTMTVKLNGMEVFETITGGSAIDATMPVASLSFSGNPQTLQYAPTAIAGNDVTNVRITVSANKS